MSTDHDGRTSRLAVVTIVSGRHRHLSAHLAALRGSHRQPDLVVVVAMGDRDVAAVVESAGLTHHGIEVVTVDLPLPAPGELPLSAARNAGANQAIERECDLLVFLDVDCLASPTALEHYEQAWRLSSARHGTENEARHIGPVLLSGPVTYLPPLAPGQNHYPTEGLGRLADPHPARPAPAPGEVVLADDLRLFWSLSFAIAARHWDTVGGFDTGYRGYGGEDTDFALRAAATGGALYWVGGADAFHQHHDVERPPVRHVRSIVGNANYFRELWGWFPMEGWLEAFERLGLVSRQVPSQRWVVVDPAEAVEPAVRDETSVVPDVLVDHPIER